MRRARTLGGATAEGEFYVVTLRTRFVSGHKNSLLHGKTKFRPDPRA